MAPPLSAPARAFAWFCWIAGGLVRLAYTWVLHPLTQHVYSDMQGYVERAQRWAAGAPETIADTLYPPGASWWFGLLYRLDPSWALAGLAQWLVSLGVLGIAALIARRLYGNGAMLVTLFIAAFYPPLIHYPALFLAENPFCLVVLLAVYCTLRALAAAGSSGLVAWAVGAGLSVGVGMALKNTMVLPALFVLLGLAARTPFRRWRLLPLSAAALASLLVLTPLAVRCTALSGHACLVANNLGMNVLMGHNGAIGEYRWRDSARGVVMSFTAVENNVRGYTASMDLPFGAYDNGANLELARRWVSAHPQSAVSAGLGHMDTTFFSAVLWPAATLAGIDWGAMTRVWFVGWMLLPSLFRFGRVLVQYAPRSGASATSAASEVLLLMPAVGLAAAAFISIGEVRFRVPFDLLILIYAAPSLAALARVGAHHHRQRS